MTPELPAAVPDGALHYRIDSTGTQVAVFPVTCKPGLHLLATAEFRAVVHEAEVRIGCAACASVPGTDHDWRLTAAGPLPDRAELDDEPYRELGRRRAIAVGR